MFMQHVTRIVLSALIAKGMTGATWAMEDVPHSDVQGAAEYKRADTNFYGKGDVVRAHPTAVIIAPGEMTQTGDSYFFTTPKKAPKSVYLEMLSDWVEPITPPDMPASLGVPPDVMQIREPQGDVQVALPSAPANFTPVTDGMSLPNGAVLKTGANGTAAVLFGGVDSARLIPNSEAAVQQTVTAQSRSAEVDLTTGAVFSKVGTQVGVKGQYDVHTPYGNASAEGGDFVTVISDSRTDVWVAQGTVELNETDGKKGPVVSSDGVGPLKIMRLPAIANAHLSFLADTESLTTVLNFIPLADQKIKALRDKLAGGATLTPNEQAYLARLKKVPCVVKLALVEPPAPAPVAPAPAPPVATAPAVNVAATPATTAPLGTLFLRVRTDGKINFQQVTYTPSQLKPKLETIAKTTPDQSFVIKAGRKVPYADVQQVLGVFHDAGLQNVTFLPPPGYSTSQVPATPEHPADNLPAPGLLMHPSMQLPPTPTTENSTTNSPPAPGP
jgi:hypothetical protein